MWTSLIAVLGTLAGATLSFVYQGRLSRAAREGERRDRLHTELLEACAGLGAALVAYRHSQLARQTHRLRSPNETSSALTEEVRQRRGDAWAAYFRVELLTADQPVLDSAAQCMTLIRNLKEIDDLGQLDRDAESARRSIHTFVHAARDQLSNGSPSRT